MVLKGATSMSHHLGVRCEHLDFARSLISTAFLLQFFLPKKHLKTQKLNTMPKIQNNAFQSLEVLKNVHHYSFSLKSNPSHGTFNRVT
jgi:hypothetical protein